MKFTILFIGLFCFVGPIVNAQEQTPVVSPKDSTLQRVFEWNRKYVQRYKEDADLSYTSPGGEIGAPSKYVINGRLTTTYMLIGTEKLPVALAIIPDFTVRVRKERSAGVRTPSFRLGGTFYVRMDNRERDYRYVSLSFVHHSNGQDGMALNPDGSINTINGNFSTNYLRLKYHFAHQYYKANSRSEGLFHVIGFEWHKWFDYEKALENDYGFSRILYDFSWRRYRQQELWRLNVSLSYAMNSMKEYDLSIMKKRLNAELAFHYALPFMHNTFLMAATGYYGEDPYNIYYRDRYGYLRLGISTGILRGADKQR
ncbi:hypothetical protein [Pedobacter sp. GR22-6]|uniref:hypothetical protein n=1 Tax=Pedobacter sp. GR22-6 TaxID=3127957 RepID=UPI00307D6FFA